MLANFLVPILEDGWRFIALFAAATFLAALTGVAWLFWPMFIVTLWSIYFFRDPSRGVPQDDGLLIAPADGLVQMVVDAVPPQELGLGDKPLTRVSIFLSVFDDDLIDAGIDGLRGAAESHRTAGLGLQAERREFQRMGQRHGVQVVGGDQVAEFREAFA